MSLEDWMLSPPALYCQTWQSEQLQKATQDVMGYYGVQLGNPMLDTLRHVQVTCKILVNPSLVVDGSYPCSITQPVIADFTHLPFSDNSVDLVILPYTLPAKNGLMPVLAEIERILVSNGRLVILGFNPYSLWGLRHRWLQPYLLPECSLLPMWQLKNSLKELAFVIDRGRFGIYNMPFSHDIEDFGRFAFLEKAGDRWWPTLGAVYMLSAIKRVHSLHAILKDSEWKLSKKSNAAVAPAHKQPDIS